MPKGRGFLAVFFGKHGEEYFKKEAEIKKTVFADFDMKLKAKEDLIKNTISKDKSNKLEFDKFMEIVKSNSLLVSFNSKILFDYLIQGIVLINVVARNPVVLTTGMNCHLPH